MSESGAAYYEDFYAWTKAQATEIRRAGAQQNDAPIDWENVAEEIDCIGKRAWNEIDSRSSTLLTHLLKWLYCADIRDAHKREWRLTIRQQRREIQDRLEQSPSLRLVLKDEFTELYADACETAALEADVDLARFPASPPFTLDEALDPAYPADLFPPEWRA